MSTESELQPVVPIGVRGFCIEACAGSNTGTLVATDHAGNRWEICTATKCGVTTERVPDAGG